ncbi:MAG TPA: hypothetical protein VE133_00405 [Candidatus Sulfotelmatobacter sp.]|nr:hypothetical protein [Candidatus Sulfotelmatobacter sp.]
MESQSQRLEGSSAQATTLCAIDTVKIPHSSIRLVDFSESVRFDQLIDFRLGPPPHDPRTKITMAGKGSRDHFQLRMIRLPGVYKETQAALCRARYCGLLSRDRVVVDRLIAGARRLPL